MNSGIAAAPPLRIGLLRLTDAASLIIAQELGYFAAEGLEVSLSVEPSWANIADKLAYGLLDGAMMLPPLALALSLGMSGGGGPEPIIVLAGISLCGNTITLATDWAEAVLADAPGRHSVRPAMEAARRFADVLRGRRPRPVLGIVHTFSTHNLLLRYWLAAGGIEPDREVDFCVVPPAETVEAMSARRIDGFCAGAPWGEVAARAGLGRAVATSHAIWNHGPEKVFALRRAVADQNPAHVQALLRALLQAASYCDKPEHADAVAAILSKPGYLGVPAEIILTSLPTTGLEPPVSPSANADAVVFFRNAASFPWRSHARWFLRQMVRWGYLRADGELEAASAIYRPELFAVAARSLGLSVPAEETKSEGYHPGRWLLPASPTPIAMGSDKFLDDARFGSAVVNFA